MRKNWLMLIAVVLIVPGLLMTTGCAKKEVMETSSTTETSTQDDTSKADDEARMKAEAEAKRQAELDRLEAEARAQAEAAEQARMSAMNRISAEDIYFEFDSAVLSPIAQDTLRWKAEWLVGSTSSFLLIEGHCDERGTDEYNMALGERRAQAVSDFLVDLGVSPARITTISYGEEKPVDAGHSEAAWAKNRRAHAMVQ